MSKTMDLTRAPEASAKDVYKTMVATFKEEAPGPRVLAESEGYISYTLKNGSTFRVICRSNNARGSFRLHTAPVHAVQFVHFRSNVAASASANDFYVWVVTKDDKDAKNSAGGHLSVNPYFKLVDKIVINSFNFFMNTSNGMPDLLVMYNNTAAVLESSKLIAKYGSTMMEATMAENSSVVRELTQSTTTSTLCSTHAAGWFAFTSETNKVIACTMRNKSTPAWNGCEGEPILRMNFIEAASPTDTAALLALASESRIYLWKLTTNAEPELARTFTFGSTITTMAVSRQCLAVFNDDGKVSLVKIRSAEDLQARVFAIGAKVPPKGICFNHTNRFATILVDAGMQLDFYQLAVEQQQTAAVEAKSAAPAQKVPFVDPSIIASSFSPSTAAPASSAAAISANPQAAMEAYQSARAALMNTSLPQSLDGLVASAIYQSDESVRKQLEGLIVVLQNVQQILHLTPEQVHRDHQQLITLALEAQMTELQQSSGELSNGAGLGTVAGTSVQQRRHAEGFNSYTMATLMAPIASEIATGLTEGIRDTLRLELDRAVRDAFGSNVRAEQREALRARLDAVLGDATSFFIRSASERVEKFISRDLGNELAAIQRTMRDLADENTKLQSALDQIINCPALSELAGLRAEVRELRQMVRNGGAGNAGGRGGRSDTAAPSPQSVIETSERYIKAGNIAMGLNYLLSAQNSRCTATVMMHLSEDELSMLIVADGVSEAVWAKLVSQLCNPAASDVAQELEKLSSILFDVLSDHDEVVLDKSAQAQQIRGDIRQFIARARAKIDSSEGRRVLKDLEKVIQ